MTVNHDQFMKIRYLKTVEKLNSVQIAEKLSLTERLVRKWWNLTAYPEQQGISRLKKIDEFIPRIESMLKDCSSLSGEQIYQKLRAIGFTGSIGCVNRYLRKSRPKTPRSFLSLNFEPGEAMQIDFGDCGTLMENGRHIRLCVCAAVLCYSRLLYAKIIPSEKQEYTFTFLKEAFEFFHGVPRKVILDNFKAAVLHHARHSPAEFHPAFSDFCAHYGILPVACNVRSPYEKGRIESGIGYIKGNFMRGNTFRSLEEAQCSLRNWLDTVANVRIHNTTRKRPIDLFQESEQAALTPVNPNPFDCSRIECRRIDSQCRFKFEGSYYSVPHIYANADVKIRITAERIFVYHSGRQITSHLRAVCKNSIVDDPGHFKVMLEERKTANRQNMMANFLALGPDAETLKRELESRVLDSTRHIKRILTLVDIYGKDSVVNALQAAVANQVFGADYVEFILRMKAAPPDSFSAPLHVTQGADNLNIKLDAPDLSIYDFK